MKPKTPAAPGRQRMTLALLALIVLIVAAVLGRPDWLRLKPATGTAQAMAAAGDLDRAR